MESQQDHAATTMAELFDFSAASTMPEQMPDIMAVEPAQTRSVCPVHPNDEQLVFSQAIDHLRLPFTVAIAMRSWPIWTNSRMQR
jgi:hypothetical protein